MRENERMREKEREGERRREKEREGERKRERKRESLIRSSLYISYLIL
jgi:hypothetical protein